MYDAADKSSSREEILLTGFLILGSLLVLVTTRFKCSLGGLICGFCPFSALAEVCHGSELTEA